MKPEWYVTFHGGAEKENRNNIHVYAADGRELRKALDTHHLPPHVKLRELRGFAFGPDGNLYVVNAYFDFSEVLLFAGKPNKDGQHEFMRVYLKRDKVRNPGVLHPFSVVFGPDENLYLTSQDTNLVLRYFGPRSTAGLPGDPMPHPSVLQGAKNTSPGTFVPSAEHFSDGINMVRKAIFGHDGNLYVADRDADCVKVYDGKTGRYLSRIETADKPIHLLFSADGKELYIGCNGANSVLKHDLHQGTTSTFIASKAGGLKAPAGLAIGGDGFFYVASRESRQILRYRDSDGSPDTKPFIDHLGDFPEFILRVDS